MLSAPQPPFPLWQQGSGSSSCHLTDLLTAPVPRGGFACSRALGGHPFSEQSLLPSCRKDSERQSHDGQLRPLEGLWVCELREARRSPEGKPQIAGARQWQLGCLSAVPAGHLPGPPLSSGGDLLALLAWVPAWVPGRAAPARASPWWGLCESKAPALCSPGEVSARGGAGLGSAVLRAVLSAGRPWPT